MRSCNIHISCVPWRLPKVSESRADRPRLLNRFNAYDFRATLDVPKPKSGDLVKKVGPFSKRKHPL